MKRIKQPPPAPPRLKQLPTANVVRALARRASAAKHACSTACRLDQSAPYRTVQILGVHVRFYMYYISTGPFHDRFHDTDLFDIQDLSVWQIDHYIDDGIDRDLSDIQC